MGEEKHRQRMRLSCKFLFGATKSIISHFKHVRSLKSHIKQRPKGPGKGEAAPNVQVATTRKLSRCEELLKVKQQVYDTDELTPTMLLDYAKINRPLVINFGSFT